jgi:hypothetical protein
MFDFQIQFKTEKMFIYRTILLIVWHQKYFHMLFLEYSFNTVTTHEYIHATNIVTVKCKGKPITGLDRL